MINTMRSREVFDASKYRDTKLVVVGAGAIGSYFVAQAACAGWEGGVVIDYDRVEDHNLGNQVYDRDDVKEYKLDALKKYITRKCGKDTADTYNYRKAKVEPGMTTFVDADILVSCVDTFEARRMLLDMAYENSTPIFIDTRMASNNGDVYVVDMSDDDAIEKYHQTIGDDDDPNYETSACGSGLSVGATSSTIGNAAWWSVMTYLRDGYHEPHVKIGMSPIEVSR